MELYHEGVVTHRFNKNNRKYSVYKIDENSLLYELTQEQFMIIDIDDFDNIKDYIWRSQRDNSIKSFYALTNVDNQVISAHRLICGVYDDCDITIDHIDRDTLNNRKSNLRLATKLQQTLNRSKHSTKITSKYRGVTLRNDSTKKKFRVRGQSNNGEQVNIGSFENEIEAAIAWDNFMFNEYKEHDPLCNVTCYNVLGRPTLDFIEFNFPDLLGIRNNENDL